MQAMAAGCGNEAKQDKATAAESPLMTVELGIEQLAKGTGQQGKLLAAGWPCCPACWPRPPPG